MHLWGPKEPTVIVYVVTFVCVTDFTFYRVVLNEKMKKNLVPLYRDAQHIFCPQHIHVDFIKSLVINVCRVEIVKNKQRNKQIKKPKTKAKQSKTPPPPPPPPPTTKTTQ